MKHLLSAFLLLALLANPAYGLISPSYPYTLQNGTTADASQVMGDFNQIQSDVNTFAAHNGANSDITSLTGLTTALALQYGGTPLYVGGTSGGSGNAQTLLVVSPNNFTLTSGFMVTGIAGFSNTSTATLAVNGLTAKAIKKGSSSGLTPLAGGEITAGNPYLYYYDGTQFEVLNPTLPTALITGPGSSTNGNIATFNGTAGNVLQDSGIQATALATKASPTFTGTPSAPTAASGTNTTQLATTAFVASQLGLAKVIANFVGSSAAVNKSLNVASVVRNSTGNYTINFTNAFSDTNYIINGVAGRTDGQGGQIGYVTSSKATSSCVVTYNGTGGASAADPAEMSITIFGN